MEAFGSLILNDDGALSPFHRTAMEWLTDEKRAGPYFVSEQEGHRRLAGWGWAEFKQGVEHMSSYFRIYLPAHLIAVGNWTSLEAVLSHPVLMDALMAEERRYQLLGYWLSSGTRLDMVGLYQQAFEQYAGSERSRENVAALAYKISCFFQVAAQYDAAFLMAQTALCTREEVLGPDHPDTASSLNKNEDELLR